MTADYDRLFQPPEGVDIPDEAAEQAGYDVNAPSSAPSMPKSPPTPDGQARAPMPVDWTAQSSPSRPKPPSPPMPVDTPRQPRPARPEPRPAPPGPRPQSPTPPARHARRDQRDAANRADSPHGRKPAAPGPSMPLRPRTDPSASARDSGHPEPWARSESNFAPPAGQATAATPAPADRNGRPRPDQPVAAVQPASIPGSTNGAPHRKLAVSDLDIKSAPKKSATKMVSRRGWRRWLHTLTRINVGLSRDEKYEIDLDTRIRRNIRGSYQVGVVGLKGGAGKTAVTAALGSVFAQVRGDRILALDADPVSGNLADRVARETDATIADLVADRALSHYNDIRAHTSMNEVNLEVLSAADYGVARRTLSEEDWRAVTVVPRYYNLVLADCGADLFGPATRSMLATASGLVIVANASVDGIQQAAIAGDWLHGNGYLDLLNRACVVINHVVPGEPNKKAVDELVHRFEQQVQPGRLIVLPWDQHIASGTEIQIDLLGDAYKRRVTELAAALSDDFDRGERR